jgi:DNA-binding IclR family transcriptional regulator
MPGRSTSSAPAQTVRRAVDLLRLIAANHSRELRLVDLAEMSGLDKSTTHRLLQRLSVERMLVRNSGQRGYRLGPLLHELGLSALPEHNLKEVARPHLSQLADQTGDMTFLVGRSGFETVCLDRIAGNFHIQTMTSGVGDRRPLGIGAGGQAILASLSDAEIKQVLATVGQQLRGYKQFTPQSLMGDVARCRKLGYSLDEGIAAPDVSAMGIAIRQTSGKLRAILCLVPRR